MISFQYNNTTVNVRFQYSYGKKTGPAALQVIGRRRIATEAEISIKNNDGVWETLAVGEAYRNPLDKFEKKVGRRMALSEATKQLADLELRKAIWKEYLRVHPINPTKEVHNTVTGA